MKKLSIITICLNQKDYIRETVESVIEQKTPEIEYIVVDGLSSDGTKEILADYRDHIDLFISEPDTGIYNAINKGVFHCTGTLVGLMHSGDRYMSSVLCEVLRHHETDPEAILYGAIKTTRGGRFEEIWGWNHETLVQRMIPHLACFVPKSVYDRYGLYDEAYQIAADYDALLRYYLHGVRFRFIDRIICEFNLNGISSRSAVTQEETEAIKKRHGLVVEERETVRRRIKRILKCILRYG